VRAQVAAHDVDERRVERQQPAALVRGGHDRPLLLSRMVDREKVLAAILDPLHRATQAPGQVGDQEVFGIEFSARAEAAPDVRLREVDPRLVDPQHSRQRAAVEVGDFRFAPHRQPLGAGIPFSEQAARLHRRRGLAPHRKLLTHDEGRARQHGVDVAERRGPRVGLVALGKERDGVRVGELDMRRQDVVLDVDQIARIDRGGAIGRDDHRDGLTHVTHGIAGQRRLKVCTVRRLAGLPQWNHRHAGEVGRRDEAEHTRPSEGAPAVDAEHPGVSVRAAHEDRVRQAGSDQVVDVAPAADEQARIFESFDRDADELHWSGNGTIRS
jgi:hypothetical protein